MRTMLRILLVASLASLSFSAGASETEVMHGYAGVGASRFTFKEQDLPDVQPVSATLFAGLELHRFLDLQVQVSVPVKTDSYSDQVSLSLTDYIGRTADLSPVGPIAIETDVALSASFFIKPKVDVGPLELYALGGFAYTRMEQQMRGNFDVDVYDASGLLFSLSNYAVEVQAERSGFSMSYGAGLAINLGNVRVSGEYVRLDKRDATGHACATSGYAGGTEIIYCDDFFNESVLDMATVGLAINF